MVALLHVRRLFDEFLPIIVCARQVSFVVLSCPSPCPPKEHLCFHWTTRSKMELKRTSQTSNLDLKPPQNTPKLNLKASLPGPQLLLAHCYYYCYSRTGGMGRSLLEYIYIYIYIQQYISKQFCCGFLQPLIAALANSNMGASGALGRPHGGPTQEDVSIFF